MRPALELRDLLDKFGSWCAWNCRFPCRDRRAHQWNPSSLMAVVVGGVLLCVSLGLVLVAASLALSFRAAARPSFLIVAVVAIVISLILRAFAGEGSQPCAGGEPLADPVVVGRSKAWRRRT